MIKSKCSRRQFILTGISAAAAGSFGMLAPNIAEASPFKRMKSFGGGGGSSFPMQYPQKVGLRSGKYIDALLLNDQQYGSSGGVATPVEALNHDEFIDQVIIRHGELIDNLYMTTNKGRLISGGGLGGKWEKISDKTIRVLRIGGSSGDLLDSIKIEYIENYQPSKLIVRGAQAVLDVRSPGSIIKKYHESYLRNTQAFQRTTESIINLNVTASAEGEYFAKFSASTSLTTTNSTKESMKTTSEKALKEGGSSTDTIGNNQIAFLISKVDIMRDATNKYWMYPSSQANWVKLTTDQVGRLRGHYDLTGAASTQAGLKSKSQYSFSVLN